MGVLAFVSITHVLQVVSYQTCVLFACLHVIQDLLWIMQLHFGMMLSIFCLPDLSLYVCTCTVSSPIHSVHMFFYFLIVQKLNSDIVKQVTKISNENVC